MLKIRGRWAFVGPERSPLRLLIKHYSAVLVTIDEREQFDHMVAYPVSKSAQVMFTLYLNDKLKSINSNVEVLAAHPGIVDTDIFNETTTTEEGVKPIVYAIPYGNAGEYIGNCASQSTSSTSRDSFKLQFRKADTLKSRSTIVVTFSPRIIDSCLPPDNLPVGAPADSSSVPYCVLCVVVIYLVLKYCCWISFRRTADQHAARPVLVIAQNRFAPTGTSFKINSSEFLSILPRNSRNVCCEEVLDEAKTMSTSTYFQKWFNYFTCYCLGPCYAILDIVINYWNNTTFELDDRKGQVAVMSGGHRGIGAFVTRDLLKTDMHVILGCRRIEDGRRFVSSLRERGVTGGKVTILSLDLASLESVRNFAEAVLRETSVINYLINNDETANLFAKQSLDIGNGKVAVDTSTGFITLPADFYHITERGAYSACFSIYSATFNTVIGWVNEQYWWRKIKVSMISMRPFTTFFRDSWFPSN
ncbi:hypothetical protein J6590_033832 [Homalodisca vitripennis]|nr:hypothetical protein J6590_033832 [Homalodisca vitripennis]